MARPSRQFDYGLLLRLRCEGKSNRQMAKAFACSHPTIAKAVRFLPDWMRKEGWGEDAVKQAITAGNLPTGN